MNESNDGNVKSQAEHGGSPANPGALTPNLTPPGPTLKERLEWLCANFAGDWWRARIGGVLPPRGLPIDYTDSNDRCTGPLLTWIRERFGVAPAIAAFDSSPNGHWESWVHEGLGAETSYYAPTQIEAVIALVCALYLAEAGADPTP